MEFTFTNEQQLLKRKLESALSKKQGKLKVAEQRQWAILDQLKREIAVLENQIDELNAMALAKSLDETLDNKPQSARGSAKLGFKI